jgi:hypothetical protein
MLLYTQLYSVYLTIVLSFEVSIRRDAYEVQIYSPGRAESCTLTPFQHCESAQVILSSRYCDLYGVYRFVKFFAIGPLRKETNQT